jgi:hypothetical protein
MLSAENRGGMSAFFEYQGVGGKIMKEAIIKMETATKKTLWLAGTECTEPDREEEFNKWYSEVHIPDIKEAAGQSISRVWRYKNKMPSPGVPQYLAIYELDTDDPAALLDKLAVENEKWKEQGRIIDCIKLDWMGVFEFIEEI